MKKFIGKPDQLISGWNDHIVDENKDVLEIIEKAIEDDWTISKLIEKLPSALIVYLANNCSGIDVANLETMEVEEWSW